jgi:ribonuclease HI
MDSERFGDAIDDRWLTKWLESGFRQLERFLAAQDPLPAKGRKRAIRPDDRRQQAAIDDRWMAEWFESGFQELDRYLDHHAAFAEWLKAHRHET